MLKNWARITLIVIWVVVLLATVGAWNPFVSLPALLKYSVLTVFGAAIFGALIILIQFYILLAVIFPLPPRADAKAPKGIWRTMLPFLFAEPRINSKAPLTLNDLIGNDQAKLEIKEIVDMIAYPEKFEASGAIVPRGMLFVGPPGVGKTLFARAIANDVGIPFYVVEGGSISGIIMGMGVLKLKTIFAKLRRHKKAILFIDEIDSIGSRRSQDRGMGGIMDMNMTLNTLLTEMDGFKGSNVIIIGATNNDGILDPALMRAGRMDRKIYFQLPNQDERKDLFAYYLSKVKSADDVNLPELAKLTQNHSPAEIATVVNEASLISLRKDGPGLINQDCLEKALIRAAVGVERSLVGSGVEIANADPSIRLDDVMGIDDVKQDILEIIDFLKHGDELRKIGAKVPRGVLLIGPPGVGKTMLTKAMANEANVPFFGLSASHFKSAFAGEGTARIKALYSQARKSPAAIIFIDEIDAIAGTMTDMGNNRTDTLNQLLIELDGISRGNVITIGATNNESNLDPAFMRSGRFDRKCYVGLPDKESRKKIIKKYLGQIKMASEPDLDKLATQSANFSGADIAAAVNEAAILAVRKGKQHVEEADLEAACDRVSVTAGHKMNNSGISFSRVADVDVKLEDVKGMEEAKAEASEVVALLKNVDLIADSGLKAPKGLLLVGPPGTGKTMLAKAIANEAGVPFYALSGSDFVQVWVGLGAQRVRAVYEQARRSGKPAIVFIDEIDAIGAKRGVDMGAGGKQEMNNTLNQFLVELDGFGKHRVLTIGATNNPQMLDSALLRPGRFDRRIDVPLPNLEGREAILKHYLKKVKLDETVNIIEIARFTVFKSGADLASIVNEAGLRAIRHGRTALSQVDLIESLERLNHGIAYSRQIILKELYATAYHEAGHAIVSYFRNRRQRIKLVTVVPRGWALGYVSPVDKDEFGPKTKEDLLSDIEVALGGYSAEKIYMKTTTAGVSSDLSYVGQIASSMIREWGMGSFVFNTAEAFAPDGARYAPQYKCSDATDREIELEIKGLVNSSLENVNQLLKDHWVQLEKIAEELVSRETLYYRDLVSILEPHRTDEDVERELSAMEDRKLVGKQPLISLHGIGAGAVNPVNPTNNRLTDLE